MPEMSDAVLGSETVSAPAFDVLASFAPLAGIIAPELRAIGGALDWVGSFTSVESVRDDVCQAIRQTGEAIAAKAGVEGLCYAFAFITGERNGIEVQALLHYCWHNLPGWASAE